MVPAPQNLPTRFPCWCRAVYSWGGESRRDLGFVEGDLIECLNAGDGSWWMGRLRRDKRMMGLFPSNFVQVLDDSFRPASRATSPMPNRTPSPNPYNPQPTETKQKPMRTPFGSYSQPDPAAAKRAELVKQESQLRAKTTSPRSHRTGSPRTVNTNGHNRNTSHVSHLSHVSHGSRSSRIPSPERRNEYSQRAVSPAPTPMYEPYRPASRGPSRGPSPAPYQGTTPAFESSPSPPPPPPPAHRYVHTKQNSNASYNEQGSGFHTPPRAVTPRQPSPQPTGFTPSPLRNAIDDVMVSLQGMGTRSRGPSPAPQEAADPWSPEAFNLSTGRKGPIRPKTAPVVVDAYKENPSSTAYDSRRISTYGSDPPQLSNYVERMESRLGRSSRRSPMPGGNRPPSRATSIEPTPPPPPQKMYQSIEHDVPPEPKLRHRKSAYEVGRSILGRTFTTRSSATNSSSGVRSDTTMASTSTAATDRSLMSGYSAGGFSATSAGSLARKKEQLHSRARSAMGLRNEHAPNDFLGRAGTPLTDISYHSSHASQPPRAESSVGWSGQADGNILGGLTAPKAKKSGIFKRMIESAKTGAATARTNFIAGDARPVSQASKRMPEGLTSVSGGFGNVYGAAVPAEKSTGASNGGHDWVQVRRDVNRANSLSRIERVERKERCQMMDYPTMAPIDELYQMAEGDEGADGRPVMNPANFQTVNLSLVDKNARFVNQLPPTTNSMSLATGYICRPYRNDVQRLRAIFTWVSEKIVWEGDFEGEVDTTRVIQAKRGCSEEVAVLVFELCNAVGIHCTIVPGYLKPPGQAIETGIVPRPNHWWNAVIVDNEWRILDCSLASPTNPRRALYSSTGPQLAESWYFLARPLETCWTHVPSSHEDQHICPPIATDVLLSLPCACPPYFKNGLDMLQYDTSLLRIEDLETAQVKLAVPVDIEVIASLQAREYVRDNDGDTFESGELITKPALAQAEWVNGQKTYTIKALLPGDEGTGILQIYAGKRGLMQSIKDIPHPLALTLPITHSGDNPMFEFVTRHPTPHAMRHDLYVAQPQTKRLAFNNTYVFAVRQHPSSLAPSTPDLNRAPSPNPFNRPNSSMSISASSTADSNPSTFSFANGTGTATGKKPAKLAIQAPGGGKILRLLRKDEGKGPVQPGLREESDGGTWETVIKVGERGMWRGLVLADRAAKWCVFAEWECV